MLILISLSFSHFCVTCLQWDAAYIRPPLVNIDVLHSTYLLASFHSSRLFRPPK